LPQSLKRSRGFSLSKIVDKLGRSINENKNLNDFANFRILTLYKIIIYFLAYIQLNQILNLTSDI